VERVGLQSIKDVVFDEQQRKVLAQQFLYSQTFAQIDPWKARAEGESSHEFNKIDIRAA
jgi:nitrite reductase (NADH) large subunit